MKLARYSKEYIDGIESFLDFAFMERKFSVHVGNVVIFFGTEGM